MKRLLILSFFLLASTTARADTYDDLMRAVGTGSVPVVADLLKKGVDVDTTDIEGNTLLMLAARDGNEQMVDLLIAYRPKLNARNSAGDTALRLASFAGHAGAVKKLVVAGARINTPGWTPLIYAAFNGHTEIVRYLLDKGGDINAGSDNGSTALMMAVRNGHIETARLLLARQADVAKTNDAGLTALDFAQKSGNETMVKLVQNAAGRR